MLRLRANESNEYSREKIPQAVSKLWTRQRTAPPRNRFVFHMVPYNLLKYLRFWSGPPPQVCRNAGHASNQWEGGVLLESNWSDWSPYNQTPCRTPPEYHGPDEIAGPKGAEGITRIPDGTPKTPRRE